MKTPAKNKFKAVEYMRQVREELSTLIQDEPNQFHEELKKSMADFLARRKKASSDGGSASARGAGQGVSN